ncbi:AbrB/MazE/SpoVT family DNA-binding domain-containing protein [Burkholderia sp. Bp8992]|uniref:AbrB/MazE/SpoVT family DNA-binding domain-containing protein n=1 Tax=unclassified Burkholderia TaxID=2613784 RepID=UPI000F57D33A|nr:MULTISPECIES: AbrB/MazE/SpoVT family DNA-binding domain-containing protein [unclassified Burkholderia]RQS36275.1 AbrB/MazE/SpoVT family DNA-binding domain-containing protein [Burkholderia sp. Bp8992]
MRVAKWGNNLAVRLPAGLVDVLGLREGDEVEIVVHRAGALAESRNARPEALLLPLRRFRGKLPGGFRFRRNDANE